MLINGEKYACEACVRGHRVSSCSHSDRKLIHVNKKGRPVSQCQHCRSLRKARSQHVKCECHDKAHAKEECPHLKSENGAEVLAAANLSNKIGDGTTCCCGHGVRCTCSLKKEHLDTVPEDITHILQPKEPHHRPKISSLNNHEGKPTIFTNGHHKPVHKINDAHNHCGAPYRVPSRSHTIHNHHREIAQRSSDNLPLLKHQPRPSESPLHSITSAPRETRKAKSEHGSPVLGAVDPQTKNLTNELFIPPLSPNAYSYSPFDSQSPTIAGNCQNDLPLPENIPESWFTTYDEAHAWDPAQGPGFTEYNTVDWSQFDFSNTGPSFPQTQQGYVANQTPPYTTPPEQLSFPGLPRVNSSSGEISEADDISTVNRPSNLRTVSNASQDLSSPGDDHSESYRISSASSFWGTPQATVLAGNLDNLDIDEYVKQTVAERNRINSQSTTRQPSIPFSSQVQSPSLQSPHIQSPHIQQSPQHVQPSPPQFQPSPQHTESPQPRHNSDVSYIMPVNPNGPEHAFTISEAQAYAHMNGNNNETGRENQSSGHQFLTEDPMWCGTADGKSAFKLDDEREDEDWVR